MNHNGIRQTGRTTWALIRLLGHSLQSDYPKAVYISPTLPMAKYNMDMFIEILENISNGKAIYNVSRSRMMVEFLGKVFEFTTHERLANQRPMPEIIIDDHTILEKEFR